MKAGILFCLCVASLLASSHGQQCLQDYECGNLPFTACVGGSYDCATTLNGLGVDYYNNQIYYAQTCRNIALTSSNITIRKVDANGGTPVLVDSRETPGPTNDYLLNRIFDVAGAMLYVDFLQRSYPGTILQMYHLGMRAFSGPIDTGAFFESALDFDITNGLSFLCKFNLTEQNYFIERYEGFIGQGPDPRQGTLLYTLGNRECTAVRKDANTNFYFSTQEYAPNSSNFTSIIHRGQSDCNPCVVPPVVVFSIANVRINDFDITSTTAYIGTTNGLTLYDFSGINTRQITNNEDVTGVRILNDKVYWNNGVAIFSASLDGSNVRQVNQPFAGTCSCRPGFSGDNCGTCNGQIEWFEGAPICASIGEDGFPETCFYDYHCGNIPFTFCSKYGGTCQCLTGFTGPQCNTCADPSQSVVWNNGIPSCQ